MSEDPWIGRVVDNRYRVVALGGHGGMASVFRADHVGLGQTVALKVLYEHADANPEGRKRFLREARTLAAIRHPHIVPVYDFGTWEGRQFLVMPWLAGGSLDDWVRSKSPSLAMRIGAVIQLLQALGAAHAEGIVHRDVKPSNVLLDAAATEPVAMLGDFGLARSYGATPSVTDAGRALGTPLYMAPEQLDPDRPLGPETDVYGAGCVAYALLTGRPPHVGRTIVDIFYAKTRHDPEPPNRVSKSFPVSARVSSVILRALERNPTHRWPDAPTFAEELARAMFESTQATRRTSAARLDRQAQAAKDAPSGRDDDARQLLRLASGALQSGSGGVVVIRGRAGIGKSELCRWLLRHIEGASPHVITCQDAAEDLSAIRVALRRLVGGKATVADALHCPARLSVEQARSFLFGNEPTRPSRELLAEWLIEHARTRPVALLFEHTERADVASIDVLVAVAEHLLRDPVPLLVLVEARSGAGARTEPLRALAQTGAASVSSIELTTRPTEAPEPLGRTWSRGRERVVRRRGGRGSAEHTQDSHPVRVDPHLAAVIAQADETAKKSDNPERFLHTVRALAVLLDDPCPEGMVEDFLGRVGPSAAEDFALAVEHGLLVDVDPTPADVFVFFSEVLRHAIRDAIPPARLAELEALCAAVRTEWNAMTDPGQLLAAARTYAGRGDATAAVRAARSAATTYAKLHGPLAGARMLDPVYALLSESDDSAHLLARGRLALHQGRLCVEGGDLDAATRHARTALRLAAVGGGEALMHDATILWRDVSDPESSEIFESCARIARSGGHRALGRRFVMTAAELRLEIGDRDGARSILGDECELCGLPRDTDPRESLMKLRLYK